MLRKCKRKKLGKEKLESLVPEGNSDKGNAFSVYFFYPG